MKFTIVFTTLMCVSTSWAVTAKNEDFKDKREAAVGYGASGFSSQGYQAPASFSQGDASAISIGAGYSIGGEKPSYNFGGPESSASLQIPSEGLSPSGHATIKLAPITLQPSQGAYTSGDLSQLMSQLSHSLNSGAISLQPSNAVAEFHQSSDGHQGQPQAQQLSLPQYTYGSPKYEFTSQYSGTPYFGGAQGQNSYASTGPVLFTPSNAPAGPTLNYGGALPGQTLAEANSLSLGGSSQSLGASGNSFGGSAHSFGGSSPSFSGASGSLQSLNLGGAAPSFGSYKQFSGSYPVPSKSSFKPSTFLGTLGGESSHGLSGLSGSYNSAPSFGSFRGNGHGGSFSSLSHGGSFGGSQGFGSGSSKFIAPSYQSYKPEGLESGSALSSGHFSSPPGTTYGLPSSSYTNSIYSASSHKPYYVSPKHYRAAHGSYGHSRYTSPVSSYGSVNAHSSGPKYSFTGPSSQFEPADAHISASENSYNTIKYSEELKLREN